MATETPEPPMDAGETPDAKKDTEPDKKGAAGGTVSDGTGGMTAQQIRDAGYAIDLPMELPDADPEPLRYAPATEGREEWTPPEGFTLGGVPWDQLPVIGEDQGAE